MLQPAGKAVGYRVFTNGYGRSMSASSAVKLVVKNGPPSPRLKWSRSHKEKCGRRFPCPDARSFSQMSKFNERYPWQRRSAS
jgi:hypothetical protein